VAFLAAVRSMLEPPEADDYVPDLPISPSEDFDPGVLLGPE